MDRRKWRKASRYFVLSKATARLAECLLHMGDVASLRELQRHLPESDAVHKQLAASYESLGLCDEAVESYLKARPPRHFPPHHVLGVKTSLGPCPRRAQNAPDG